MEIDVTHGMVKSIVSVVLPSSKFFALYEKEQLGLAQMDFLVCLASDFSSLSFCSCQKETLPTTASGSKKSKHGT